jgi:AcrR family transcriptional regulator
MSRSYDTRQRNRSAEVLRERILAAAQELLDDDAADGFAIDDISRRAGVARMTVYNQFGSKAKLLKELFASFARQGEMGRMSDVFRQADPLVALDEFVARFGRFWTAKRRAHERLWAAALSDPELRAAIVGRNERRRKGLRELLRRLRDRRRSSIPEAELVNVLFVLLSFETWNALAGPDRAPQDVIPMVQHLARVIIGIDAAAG